MQSFVTALTNSETGITTDALWGGIVPLAGLVVTLVIFGFSYYVSRRAVKGASKGKARI